MTVLFMIYLYSSGFYDYGYYYFMIRYYYNFSIVSASSLNY